MSRATSPSAGEALPSRRRWLDWQRGFAVLLMVEAHTLDAWLAPSAERGLLHDVLHMMGGFAAPAFLFMAGFSQVLADDALRRRGGTRAERQRRAIGRAVWLLGIAYLFRVAEYLLGGMYRVAGGWHDILRVDVLNVMAVSLALSGLLLTTLPERLHLVLAGGAAAALAAVTPVVAGWSHPPSRLLDYVYATYPRANFSLCNWGGFLLAGSAAGRIVARRDRPACLLLLGAVLLAGGWAGELSPPLYAHQDFWRTSPGWFAMRLGGVVACTGALQLLPGPAERVLSWLRTLGRHSLFVYVVSVELTYGHLSSALHRSLSQGATLGGIIVMTALTWALCAALDWRERRGGRGRCPTRPGDAPSTA